MNTKRRPAAHIRRVGSQWYQWDMPTLWAAAENLPVEEVDIGSVAVLDEIRWFGPKRQPTVRNVAEDCRRIINVSLDYPIILGPDGAAMDGSHRVARALVMGLNTIKAIRLTTLPPPDRIGR